VSSRARSSDSAGAAIPRQLLERHRVPREAEVYSEMYYKERIQPRIEAAFPEGKRKGKIALIQKVTKDMWEEEDEEMKGAVRSKIAEIAALKEKDGPRSPEQYHT
jgi:transposase